MTLETSITFLENFRRQLKPGTDIDRALERVLDEVKDKPRHLYNPKKQKFYRGEANAAVNKS